MSSKLTTQEQNEYASAMAMQSFLQRIHEEHLKGQGLWTEPGKDEEEEDIMMLYDDPSLLLLTDADPL